MLPVLPDSYIFCEYVVSVSNISIKDVCIFTTREEGLVFKRVSEITDKNILLASDNKEYEPYYVALADIREIWKAKGVLSFNLPEPEQKDDVMEMLTQIKEDLDHLKKQK